MNISVQLLHVFTDKAGNFGDKASIVLDEGKHIADLQRQTITGKLNTGETVFINDIQSANISVMHTQGEIDFAGVGVLGTAWLLMNLLKRHKNTIHGRGGAI